MFRTLTSLCLILTVGLAGCAQFDILKPVEVTPGPEAQKVEMTLDEAFAALDAYEFGKSRTALFVIENTVMTAEAQEEPVLERRLLAKLDNPELSLNARRFVARQLGYCGSSASVEPLAGLLGDEDFADMALFSLKKLPGEKPEAAMREALEGAELPAVQIELLSVLALRGDEQSLALMERYAQSGDPAVAGAAINAMGNLATDEAVEALKAMAEQASGEKLVAVQHALLDGADRQVAAGQSAEAKSIYQSLYEDGRMPSIRAAALAGLVAVAPGETTDLLFEILDESESRIERGQAWALLGSIEGESTTLKLAGRGTGASSATQLLTIGMMARRQDPAALPWLMTMAQSEEAQVREAAYQAAGLIDDASGAVALLNASIIGGAADRQAAERALDTMANPEVDALLIEMLEIDDPELMIAAARSLGARGAEEATPRLVELAEHENEDIQKQALRSLGNVGGADYLASLIDRLLQAESPGVRRAARDAIVEICKRIPQPDQRDVAVVEAYRNAETEKDKVDLLAILSDIGGKGGLEVLREAVDAPSEEIQDVAVRSLAQWPDATPIEELRQIASETDNDTHHVLAVRGVIRQIPMVKDQSTTDTLAAYEEAIELARRTQEKGMALGAIGDINDPAAVETLRPYLKNEELRDEAVVSMLKLVKMLGQKNYPHLAATTYEETLPYVEEGQFEVLVSEAHAVVDEHKGSIVMWQISGPFTFEGAEYPDLYDRAFGPEQPEEAPTVEWIEFKDKEVEPRTVLLHDIMDGDVRVAYLRTRVWAPRTMRARLDLASDDGCRVWVNGEHVFGYRSTRGLNLWSNEIPIVLCEGWNEVYLKSLQNSAGWGVAARIRAADGSAIEDLQFDIQGPFKGLEGEFEDCSDELPPEAETASAE